MAFVDFHATGEAPARSAAKVHTLPRIRQSPRRRKPARRWHLLMAMAAALPALAMAARLAMQVFDDALLGALGAVLLYAAGAPIAARLLDTGPRQPRASYQRIGDASHSRG